MATKYWILLGILVVGLSVGSTAYFSQESRLDASVEARNRALEQYAELRSRAQQYADIRKTTTETEAPATVPDCHFVLNDNSYNGDRFLLDECTGDVWYYDQGQGYDSSDNWKQLQPRK